MFALIAPLLHPGMIRPADEQHQKPDKNRWQIRQDVQALQATAADGSNYLALFNLIEQACNYYLAHDAFPQTYEQMQEIPVLKTAQLTYAADDGREQGQAYQLRYDLDAGTGCCGCAHRRRTTPGIGIGGMPLVPRCSSCRRWSCCACGLENAWRRPCG